MPVNGIESNGYEANFMAQQIQSSRETGAAVPTQTTGQDRVEISTEAREMAESSRENTQTEEAPADNRVDEQSE